MRRPTIVETFRRVAMDGRIATPLVSMHRLQFEFTRIDSLRIARKNNNGGFMAVYAIPVISVPTSISIIFL